MILLSARKGYVDPAIKLESEWIKSSEEKMKISKRNWSYILILCVVFSAAYWKGKQREFPYTGTWVNSKVYADGVKRKTVLIFSEDKGCSLTINGTKRNQLQCSYLMSGRSAILTCYAAIESPGWSHMELINYITPVDGGQKLYLESAKIVYINERTGKRQEQQANNKIMLKAVS